jgi:hypothetical protein
MAEKRTMKSFMKGQAKETKSEFVIVSKRYTDEEGKVIPFEIKAIPTERIEQLQDECTIPVYKKRQKVDEKLDVKRFAGRMAVESTVFPDFKDPELLASYGLIDPVDLAKAVLNVGGEYIEWVQAVQRVNGFDEDFEELVEEAKN